MTSTIELCGHEDGTKLTANHQGLPPGISPEHNQLGWQQALEKLRKLVEEPTHSPPLAFTNRTE